jgi:phosphate transport system substrate-binding protein
MRAKTTVFILAVLLQPDPARPADHDGLAPYQAKTQVSGTIRTWGNDEMSAVMSGWERGFHQYHPEVRFEDRLMGPASAMAGLYTSTADLALMGHELRIEESMAFEWVFQYKALPVEVATAGFGEHIHNAPLAVFVNRENPLSQMTLAQLDGAFGSEHKRGAGNLRKWGDLGLTGSWAEQPIRLYGYDPATEAGLYFRQFALGDSYKWNCDVREFPDRQQADGKVIDAGQDILQTLASDKYGLAYSKLLYATKDVKALALSTDEKGPFLGPTRDGLRDRKYPLARAMTVYVNRKPGAPMTPALKEFLGFILSREGQEIIVREGGYLPLTSEVAREQIRKLE